MCPSSRLSLFRSFAAISGQSALIDDASGRSITEVILGPVAFYSTSMVAICWGLAWRHHHDWLRSGRQFRMLLMEARAARIDALISGLTGIALLASPLLEGTPFASLSPVTDSLLVLVVSMVFLKAPLLTFWNALGHSAGVSVKTEIIRSTRLPLEDFLAGLSCWLLDLTVMKVRRMVFVVVYLNPHQPMDGAAPNLRAFYGAAVSSWRCRVDQN